jgi:hypothetical protein
MVRKGSWVQLPLVAPLGIANMQESMTSQELAALKDTRSLLGVRALGRGFIGVVGLVCGTKIDNAPLMLVSLFTGVNAVSCLERYFEADKIIGNYDYGNR